MLLLAAEVDESTIVPCDGRLLRAGAVPVAYPEAAEVDEDSS